MREPNIVYSGLSRRVIVDGLELRIEIYRLEDEPLAVHSYAANASLVVMGAYVQYAERLLIWRHVAPHGQLPICNTA